MSLFQEADKEQQLEEQQEQQKIEQLNQQQQLQNVSDISQKEDKTSLNLSDVNQQQYTQMQQQTIQDSYQQQPPVQYQQQNQYQQQQPIQYQNQQFQQPVQTIQTQQEQQQPIDQQQQPIDQQQQQQKKTLPTASDQKPQIQLINPVIVEETLNRFVKYTVTGYDKDGNFEKQRRYNDFYHLKQSLTVRWPGCFIPAIPQKPMTKIGGLDPIFIERRRKKLENFLKKVAELPHLFYSEEFQIFIRSDTPDIEKAFNYLKKIHKIDLIEKYKDNFMYLQEISLTTDIICKISDFNNFLQTQSILLKKFKEMCLNTSSQRIKLNEQLQTFYNYCMPDYEKNCLIEYVSGEDQIFFGNTNQFDLNDLLQQVQQLHQYDDAFQEMADYITSEQESITAFIDTLNQQKIIEKEKEKFLKKKTELQVQHQKVVAGKKTLKSFFTGSSKESQAYQLQQQIIDCEKELQQSTELSNIITIILGYMEIDKFKNEQAKEYFSLLNSMSELEIQYNELIMKIWNHILNHNNIKLMK